MALRLAAAIIDDEANYAIVDVVTDAGTPAAADAVFNVNRAAFVAAYPTSDFSWGTSDTVLITFLGGADTVANAEDLAVLQPLASGIGVGVAARAGRVAAVIVARLLLFRHSILA